MSSDFAIIVPRILDAAVARELLYKLKIIGIEMLSTFASDRKYILRLRVHGPHNLKICLRGCRPDRV